MKQKLARYLSAEDGAVTVDWVVLTAAIVGLAMIILVPFAASVDGLGQKVGESTVDYTPNFSNN